MDKQASGDYKISEFIMSVDDELVQCVVIDDGQHLQANVVTSQEDGIGAWALFESTTDNITIANAMAPLVRAGSMQPDIDVTEYVDGALIAGTAQLPAQGQGPEPQTVH